MSGLVRSIKNTVAGIALALSMACFSASMVPPAIAPIKTIELNAINTLVFNEDIDAASADWFVSALIGKRMMLDRHDPKATMYVIIASGGGVYYDVKMMRAMLAKIPNVAVICKYCASAAGYLFITFPGKRYVIEKSHVLMHEMYIPKLTAAQVDTYNFESLIKDSEEFNEEHYRRIGITRKEYEKKIIEKEWSVFGAGIIEIHLADEIIKLSCNPYVQRMAPDTCKQ